MEKNDHTFHYQQNLSWNQANSLPGFQLKYTTLGKLNADRSNVIWICHALTGSSDFTDWWSGLFDEGDFLIHANILLFVPTYWVDVMVQPGHFPLNPKTGKPYYHSFPTVTNRDVVQAFDLLRQGTSIRYSTYAYRRIVRWPAST